MKRALALAALFLAAASPALAQSRADQGKAIFNSTCALCHDERGHATTLLEKRLGKEKAVLAQRTDLQPEYIAYAVRHGVGSMPWYRRVELSDAQLGLVTAYLTQKKPAVKGGTKRK